MSFVKGNLAFSILRIVGDIPTMVEIESAALGMPYLPLEPRQLQRTSVVDPCAEIAADFIHPFRSPVSSRYCMFDVVHERRVPESKLVSRTVKERVDQETMMKARMSIGWKMPKGRPQEIREEVEKELGETAAPVIVRYSALIDCESKLMLVSCRQGAGMDKVIEVAKQLTKDACVFLDELSCDFETSAKICPFAISDDQSSPPRNRGEWLREFVTWMAACSLSHDRGTEAHDMMRVMFPGKRGKAMTLKSGDGSKEVEEFCVSALADGGIVKEFTLFLGGDFFRDKREEIRFRMNSTGYVSGIQTGLKTKDRRKQAWLAAEGACAIASRIAQMQKVFLSKRKSAHEWGTEAARIRRIVRDRTLMSQGAT